MAIKTEIAWCDSTFNAVIGCQRVSEACNSCYAEALVKRYGWTEWGPHGERKRTSLAYWRQPLKWERQASDFQTKTGHRQRVFCCSLADVFDNRWPPGARPDLFALIRKTPTLDWLLLTKRPENIGRFLPEDWGSGYPNVWLGVTAEDQNCLDRRWPILSRIPARIRFISYEPALTPLEITHSVLPDWLICGGESGPRARMMEHAWARKARDDCASLGIAFFMKQMTKLAPIPDDLLVREWPHGNQRSGEAARSGEALSREAAI